MNINVNVKADVKVKVRLNVKMNVNAKMNVSVNVKCKCVCDHAGDRPVPASRKPDRWLSGMVTTGVPTAKALSAATGELTG